MNTPGNATTKYDAVIFDLDGVITDTARYHYLAWMRLASTQGVHFDEEFNEQLKGIDRMGSLERILMAATRQYTLAEKLALAEEKNAQYVALIANMTPDDLLPGALKALDSCRAAGMRIGLASVSKNALTVLDKLGIASRFDYVVDAARLERGKPDPEIFLKAASALDVPPARCLGVEDAVAGVAAIKSAGMTAVGIGDPAVLSQADFVIPGLNRFELSHY